MINFKIIYNFLIIGLLSFGGGYSTIPLVKEVVNEFEVLNVEMLENFIAISESTPGPIAANLATFVGVEIGGILGGILATVFEILPSFVIILIVAIFLKKYISNSNVKFALSIIRPCVVGIIMAVGVTMFVKEPFQAFIELNKINWVYSDYLMVLVKYFIIAIILILVIFLYKKVVKKKLSSIKIILIGAILGIAINYLL